MGKNVTKMVSFKIYDYENDIKEYIESVKGTGKDYSEYIKELIRKDMGDIEKMFIYSLTYANKNDIKKVLELLDKKCNRNGRQILNPTVSKTLDNHFLLNFWSKDKIKMKRGKNSNCLNVIIEEKKMIESLLVV
jgi:hypothetical protein